jgi:hypothetical protein
MIRKLSDKVQIPASGLRELTKRSRQICYRLEDQERLSKSTKYPDWAKCDDLAGHLKASR